MYRDIEPGQLAATHPETPTVCMAVLRVGDRFALQLRDARPDIANPGCWGLFSGSKWPEELPGQAMARELREELGLKMPPPGLLLALHEDFNAFFRSEIVVAAFEVDATSTWPNHRLYEGERAALFSQAELRSLSPLAPLSKEVLRRYLSLRGPAPGRSRGPAGTLAP